MSERRELELAEETDGLLLVGVLDDVAVEVELERQVAAHGREAPAELEQVPVLGDLLPDPGVLDLVEARQQAVERAELPDEGLGRLLADARNAGDVVRRVAPKGQDVDDRAGLDAEDLLDPGLVDGRLLGRVPDGGGRVDDLEEVLVGGDDDRPEAFFGRPDGERGDGVVGLVLGELGRGDPQGLEDVLEDGHLDGEVVRHGLAVGLVLAVLLVADRRSLDVEDDAQVVGLFGVEELAQGADEAEDGAGREAGRVGQAPDGVVGAVEEGVPVDEEEPFRTQSYLPSTICPRMVLCCSSIIRSIRPAASGRSSRAV